MIPLELLKKHCKFTNDYDIYVLFGIARKKDNAMITNAQEVVFREVIKEEDNIEKKYTKLITTCKAYKTIDNKSLNFYVYISVNGRDVRKGYIAFKNMMINYEREILFGTDCHNQLKRVDAIWVSSIMKPEGRSMQNKRFLIDIDTKDYDLLSKIRKNLDNVGANVLLEQETKNGFHQVTETFDKMKFMNIIINEGIKDICEVKTDALFFVEYIEVKK